MQYFYEPGLNLKKQLMDIIKLHHTYKTLFAKSYTNVILKRKINQGVF